jgi:hypothetical protein
MTFPKVLEVEELSLRKDYEGQQPNGPCRPHITMKVTVYM